MWHEHPFHVRVSVSWLTQWGSLTSGKGCKSENLCKCFMSNNFVSSTVIHLSKHFIRSYRYSVWRCIHVVLQRGIDERTVPSIRGEINHAVEHNGFWAVQILEPSMRRKTCTQTHFERKSSVVVCQVRKAEDIVCSKFHFICRIDRGHSS